MSLRNRWLVILGLFGELAWQTKDFAWFEEAKTLAIACAFTALACFAASVFVATIPTFRWAAAHAFFWTGANAKWMTQDWDIWAVMPWLPRAMFIVCIICLAVSVYMCKEDKEALLGFFGRVKRARSSETAAP